MSETRSEKIQRIMLSWPGVEGQPHRFGGTEYRLGSGEIGHVHGQSLVDIPLPKRVRDDLIAKGTARPHHVLPDSGWVSVPMHSMEDVDAAIEMLRISYDIACEQLARRSASAGELDAGR
jgi:hypothetical protein